MNLASKNSYRTGIWLSNIINYSRGSHWGGWVRWMQHIWKTTFGGRRPSEEDDLLWKTTFCGRLPFLEDYLLWKMTFSGRTTFSGRWTLVKDDLWWWLLPLTFTEELRPNWNCYQLSQPEIEFAIVEKLCSIVHALMCRKKMAFVGKDD